MARVVALPAPNSREKTQWYVQCYIAHLPAAGKMVQFNRSQYNRAGVERVMGFASDDEVGAFFRTVPELERMRLRSGVQLLKYGFSITDDAQQLRFLGRNNAPLKQWKLSPMDLETPRRWEACTVAREAMLERKQHRRDAEAPWWVVGGGWWIVQAVDKKRARLNCSKHLLQQMPSAEVERAAIALPERVRNPATIRRPVPPEMVVPEVF